MKSKSLVPIGDRYVVLPKEVEEKTKSGIFIPNTIEKERPQQGKVIFSSPSDEISVGDTVIFRKYAPEEVEIDEVLYYIIDYTDILAIVIN